MSSQKSHKFTVGDLTISPLLLGEIEDTPQNWFEDTLAEVSGQLTRIPVICLHVAGPDISVLIDACDPVQYPIAGTNPANIHDALEAAGICPGSITRVILTHGHHDHFCGVWNQSEQRPNFPDARHVLSSRDWDRGTLTKAAQFADGDAADPKPLEKIHQMGLLDLDANGLDLPTGIELLEAPGETDGHRVVHISSGGQHFFFLADLFHVSAELNAPELCPIWADSSELRSSRAKVGELIRQTGAHFMCSHMAEVFTADELAE